MLLAVLSVVLLLGGLAALILPEDYEGEEVYRIDPLHAIRMLDALGGLLLLAGSIVAWIAGLAWQHRVDGT